MYTFGSKFDHVADLKATIYIGGAVFAEYLINPNVIPEA